MENSENLGYKLPEQTGALYELKKNKNDLNETLELKLIDKKQITHDTFIYTYEIPNDLYLGLNLGQHIAVDARITTEEFPEGDLVCRKYTPISNIFEKGKFQILMKVYYKDVHPQFPLGGKMSQYLNDLPLQEIIKVRGPFGKIQYFGDGNFKIQTKFRPPTFLEQQFKKVGMLAGGTGITPFYQILQAAEMNKDIAEFSLVFGNKTTQDILLHEELVRMEKGQNFKFSLYFTISNEEEGWTGGVGRISKEMIEVHIPPPGDDTIIFLCGPPVMCRKHLLPILLQIGHKETNIFEF